MNEPGEKPTCADPQPVWDGKSKVTIGDPDSPTQPGRRPFFYFRDLGVAASTHGRMSANIVGTTAGLSQPTGWHYHVCEVQFVYMLSGWVDLEFEDGTFCHLEAGQSIQIPSGMRHNETKTSETFEMIEIQVPAGMKTVACDPPPDWPKVDRQLEH